MLTLHISIFGNLLLYEDWFKRITFFRTMKIWSIFSRVITFLDTLYFEQQQCQISGHFEVWILRYRYIFVISRGCLMSPMYQTVNIKHRNKNWAKWIKPNSHHPRLRGHHHKHKVESVIRGSILSHSKSLELVDIHHIMGA